MFICPCASTAPSTQLPSNHEQDIPELQPVLFDALFDQRCPKHQRLPRIDQNQMYDIPGEALVSNTTILSMCSSLHQRQTHVPGYDKDKAELESMKPYTPAPDSNPWSAISRLPAGGNIFCCAIFLVLKNKCKINFTWVEQQPPVNLQRKAAKEP